MYLTEIFRIFHLRAIEYTFFSAAHGAFYKVEHITGHKVSLNKCKKTKIVCCILSDHNGIKLDINRKRKYRNYSSTWKLNFWVTEETGRELKNFLESNENGNTRYQNL
jgi:hypothetical protein